MKHALGALTFVALFAIAQDAAAYWGPITLPDGPGEYDYGGRNG